MLQCLIHNKFRGSALRLTAGPTQPHTNVLVNRINRKSTFRYLKQVDKKPCFDLRNVTIIRGNENHALMVTSFLNTHYWPREPSIVGLWMPLDGDYLKLLNAKYSHMGERLLAMEVMPRTHEYKMIGLTVADRVYPWMIGELEQWGHTSDCKAERHHMYFCAHCLKSSNVFNTYKVQYVYDIQVLGTSPEVTGHGVGTLLLNSALDSAYEMRHPLVQVVSTSKYASTICERCGMKPVWKMDYREYIDKCGQSVFYPRLPHTTVTVYVKYFEPHIGGKLPCLPPF